MEFSGCDYIIIKDKHFGFLEVMRIKDKRMESATKAIHSFIYTFGLPHSVKTANGPAFRYGSLAG